jgi:hypothetical protein
MSLTYEDGSHIKVGDVVGENARPERYIVFGFVETHSAHLLLIGSVVKEDDPKFGKTIVMSTGFTREIPVGVLQRLGYASITIEKD